MPERIASTEINTESQTNNELEEALNAAKQEIGKIFDQAQTKQQNPIDFFVKNGDFERTKNVYGEDRVLKFLEDMKVVPINERQQFIDGLFSLVQPFLVDRYTNDEIRQRFEKEANAARGQEKIAVEHLNAVIYNIHTAFVINKGTPLETSIEAGDTVLEISWSKNPPTGLKDALASFKKIAELINNRPEIKAVVINSWMVSHPLIQHLGFQEIPNVITDDQDRQTIIDMVTRARKNKPYAQNSDEIKVSFGAMSREEFLKRYQ